MISPPLAEAIERAQRHGVLGSGSGVGNGEEDAALQRQTRALVWRHRRKRVVLRSLVAQDRYGRPRAQSVAAHQQVGLDDAYELDRGDELTAMWSMLAECMQPLLSRCFARCISTSETEAGAASARPTTKTSQATAHSEGIDADGQRLTENSSSVAMHNLSATTGSKDNPVYGGGDDYDGDEEEAREQDGQEEDGVDAFVCRQQRVHRFGWPPARFFIIFGISISMALLVVVTASSVAWLAVAYYFALGAWILRSYLFDRRVDQFYAGYPVNALLFLRCDAAPAVHMRSVPSLGLLGLAGYTFGVFALTTTLPSEYPTVSECSRSADSQDVCEAVSVASFASECFGYLAVIAAASTMCMYFAISRQAQLALRDAVLDLCRDPISTSVVFVAETRATLELESLWRTRPALPIFAHSIGPTIGLLYSIDVLSDQVEFDGGTDAGSVVACLGLTLALYCFILTVIVQASAVYIMYEGAGKRLAAVNDYVLVHGLPDARTLVTWYKVRERYTNLVNPTIFEAGNGAMLCALLFVVQTTASVVRLEIQMSDAGASAEKIIEQLWTLIFVLIVEVGVFYIALKIIVDVVLEMSECKGLLEDAKLQAASRHLLIKPGKSKRKPPHGGSGQAGSPRKRRASQLPLCLGMHSGAIEETDGPVVMNQEELDQFNAVVDGYIARAEEYDIMPTLLGMPVSLLMIRTVAAYFASILLAIVVYFYQEYFGGPGSGG